MRRLAGRWLRRTGPFFWLSVILALAGTIYLTGLLESTAGLVWTGTSVHGSETNGMIVYSYKGRNFTLDDPGSYRTGPQTVYVDPADPSNAVVDRIIPRVSEAFFVIAPYAAAIGFGTFGLTRRRRRLREAAEARRGGAFGFGFADDALSRTFPDRLPGSGADTLSQ